MNLVLRPADARALVVLGHGAGAGMRHPFMQELAAALGRHGIATWRYEFPYMAAGKKRPDARGVLVGTVRAELAAAAREHCDLPLLAGGKSMGGRMSSLACLDGPPDTVHGLVFFGFPLHPARRPERAAEHLRGGHLAEVPLPMLFLQGTRDALADITAMRHRAADLGQATLHVVDDADHSFALPKRAGRTHAEVIDELATVTARWISGLASRGTTTS